MPNLKILVVDDDAVVRSLCEIILKRQKFHPILAADGIEGLERFKEFRNDIALVLSDIKMPGMDGIAMVKQMLELKPRSKVILMSGFSPDYPSSAGDLSKVCLFIQKPFAPGEIISAVEKCLGVKDKNERMGSSRNT